MKKLLILIPAYNEAENIERVVDNIENNYSEYDYVIVNNVVEEAAEELKTILRAESLKTSNRKKFIDEVLRYDA